MHCCLVTPAVVTRQRFTMLRYAYVARLVLFVLVCQLVAMLLIQHVSGRKLNRTELNY
jgi:hypothetical protein